MDVTEADIAEAVNEVVIESDRRTVDSEVVSVELYAAAVPSAAAGETAGAVELVSAAKTTDAVVAAVVALAGETFDAVVAVADSVGTSGGADCRMIVFGAQTGAVVVKMDYSVLSKQLLADADAQDREDALVEIICFGTSSDACGLSQSTSLAGYSLKDETDVLWEQSRTDQGFGPGPVVGSD